jgi:hypothetical protein
MEWKPYIKHLCLTVTCEGGSDGVNGLETKTKNHLWLTVRGHLIGDLIVI